MKTGYQAGIVFWGILVKLEELKEKNRNQSNQSLRTCRGFVKKVYFRIGTPLMKDVGGGAFYEVRFQGGRDFCNPSSGH